MKVLLNRFKRKKIVRCKVCGSIILVRLDECTKRDFIDFSGYFRCECPVCKSPIKVKNFKEL